MNKTSGINEILVDKMINDIVATSDRVSNILNQLDELIQESKTFYNCESSTVFYNNFNQFANNFKILKKNILSYSEDFANVKSNYQARIIEFTTGMKSKSQI